MPIKKITDFAEGSGLLSGDDVFLFVDNPAGSGVSKKISLSDIGVALGAGSTSVFGLGTVSGTNAINYGTNKLIQTLTLNGSSVTFTKGSGWPSSATASCDILLRITVSSATTITWSIVTDWFNQPPIGALSVGTHLILLRAIGSSIVEGHYIKKKTN
jgi:hypothetical protein